MSWYGTLSMHVTGPLRKESTGTVTSGSVMLSLGWIRCCYPEQSVEQATEIATPFWRPNAVICTSRVRWDRYPFKPVHRMQRACMQMILFNVSKWGCNLQLGVMRWQSTCWQDKQMTGYQITSCVKTKTKKCEFLHELGTDIWIYFYEEATWASTAP